MALISRPSWPPRVAGIMDDFPPLGVDWQTTPRCLAAAAAQDHQTMYITIFARKFASVNHLTSTLHRAETGVYIVEVERQHGSSGCLYCGRGSEAGEVLCRFPPANLL